MLSGTLAAPEMLDLHRELIPASCAAWPYLVQADGCCSAMVDVPLHNLAGESTRPARASRKHVNVSQIFLVIEVSGVCALCYRGSASTRSSALPADASCEDLDVDPSLSFLDGYVSEALHSGAAPYISQQDRSAMGVVRPSHQDEVPVVPHPSSHALPCTGFFRVAQGEARDRVSAAGEARLIQVAADW